MAALKPSRPKKPFLDFSNVRGDVFGGLTAGVVALPLALAFGEASGAGPIAGLWGAILVGFFAALFGGTGSQVSGPTGPMIVVFAGLYADHPEAPSLIFATVVVAGLLQILFGVLHFGQYIRLVPYPVISGFMSGIGCIIIALQLARLFGHEPDEGSSGTVPALQAVPGAIADPVWPAVLIGAVTLLVVFTWPKTLARFVPGALAALLIGTVLGTLVPGAPILGDIPTQFPSIVVPVIGDSFTHDLFRTLLESAFILALLGSIDSLLTSLVADTMTRERHNGNRELVGQGIGNAIAGLFGGIPGAGATMRTVVNIRTGGRTKLSGMIHALLLFAVVVSLAPLAAQIPHAVLAGILVKVGYDIIDFSYLTRAHRGPRWDLVLMALVLTLTVFDDLINAVAVGVVLAALAFVKRMAKEQLDKFGDQDLLRTSPEERVLLDSSKGRVTLFDFAGPLSFGAAADLGHQVRERVTKKRSAIILDFTSVPFVDVSAALAVETIACDAKRAGRAVFVTGINDEVRKVLRGLRADHCFPEGSEYERRIDALRAACDLVEAQIRDDPAATVPP